MRLDRLRKMFQRHIALILDSHEKKYFIKDYETILELEEFKMLGDILLGKYIPSMRELNLIIYSLFNMQSKTISKEEKECIYKYVLNIFNGESTYDQESFLIWSNIVIRINRIANALYNLELIYDTLRNIEEYYFTVDVEVEGDVDKVGDYFDSILYNISKYIYDLHYYPIEGRIKSINNLYDDYFKAQNERGHF